MPIDIHGWVEVTRHDEPERSEEHAWSAVINIGALVDVGDAVSHRLFGIGLKCPPASHAVTPLAADRGLPQFPSEVVSRDIAMVRALEAQSGYSEFDGFTFATWRELSSLGLSEADLQESDWQAVFEVVRCLATDERLGPDKIRFVVWYSI